MFTLFRCSIVNLRRKHAFKRVVLSVLAFTLLAGASPSVGTADSQRYLDEIKALTTPAMEGRGDGTKGLTRAADLIEKRFKQLGLQPAGDHSYFQPFSVVTGAKLTGHNRLLVEQGAEKKELKLEQDFVPFSFSSSGSAAA